MTDVHQHRLAVQLTVASHSWDQSGPQIRHRALMEGAKGGNLRGLCCRRRCWKKSQQTGGGELPSWKPRSPRGRTWQAGPGSAEHRAEHRHHSSGSPNTSRLKLSGTKRKRAYQRHWKKFLSVIFCGIGKRETSYSICYPCKWNVTLKRPKRKVPFTKKGWSLGTGCLKCLSLINKILLFLRACICMRVHTSQSANPDFILRTIVNTNYWFWIPRGP